MNFYIKYDINLIIIQIFLIHPLRLVSKKIHIQIIIQTAVLLCHRVLSCRPRASDLNCSRKLEIQPH